MQIDIDRYRRIDKQTRHRIHTEIQTAKQFQTNRETLNETYRQIDRLKETRQKITLKQTDKPTHNSKKKSLLYTFRRTQTEGKEVQEEMGEEEDLRREEEGRRRAARGPSRSLRG